MESILKCENLQKSFGKKKILHNVSFELFAGDILAFIGPNGAGKTTTIKLILGLQSIDSGKVTINGFDVRKDFVKAIERVGAIVENPDSYMYLTGYQNMKLLANQYSNITDERIKELLKLVELDQHMNEKVSKYSLGMRQRLGIAKSLVNNPNLLILDEPTNGLDPEGIRDLRNLLKKLAGDGVAILISSHNLSELENFCNKVCVIKQGNIVTTEDLNSFKKDNNKYLFKVNKTEKILNQENIEKVQDDSFVLNGSKDDVAKLVRKLVKENIDIYEIKQMEVSLEEAFFDKTGGK
jgi:ABC-2 type transport system ATP-binding protein